MMKHTYAHCDGPLPCVPGKSPFHIKGEFYRQVTATIEHYQARTDGAVVPALKKEGLATYLDQKFLASSLYDILPLPRVFMVLSAVLERDVHEMTSRIGKSAIQQSMKGVYQSLFLRLSPQNFAERFPGILSHIYDFGPATVTRDPEGASMVREGVPLCVAEWWCLVTVPFVEVPLTSNGARDLTVEWRIEPRGAKSGVPLGNVIWKLRWK